LLSKDKYIVKLFYCYSKFEPRQQNQFSAIIKIIASDKKKKISFLKSEQILVDLSVDFDKCDDINYLNNILPLCEQNTFIRLILIVLFSLQHLEREIESNFGCFFKNKKKLQVADP